VSGLIVLIKGGGKEGDFWSAYKSPKKRAARRAKEKGLDFAKGRQG